MPLDKEKAQFMFKLTRSKGNWGAKYDRLEHFKRFQNLEKIVKELKNKGWLLVKKKENYVGISLNSKFKAEIMEFIERKIPELRGTVK